MAAHRPNPRDLGGQAQIWRSSGDAEPGRIVRGLILNHAPGQESIQRITRIAEKVRRSLGRPSEHLEPEFPQEGSDFAQSADPQKTEAAWDEIYKQSRRKQERFQRLLEERLARGEDHDQAFDAALQASDSDEGESDAGLLDRDQRLLLERASKFYLQLDELFKDAPIESLGALHTLFIGTGDLCGGLAQAMSPRVEFLDDRGLRIVQLKRALRGAAFARGALYNIDSATMPAAVFESLKSSLEEIEEEMFGELGRLRESL